MLLDTSLVVALLSTKKGTPLLKAISQELKDEPLHMSMVQIGELSDWCLRNGADPERLLAKLKRSVEFLPLSEAISLEGSLIKRRARRSGAGKFSLMDGLVLASGRSLKERVITLDKDLAGFDDVTVIAERT